MSQGGIISPSVIKILVNYHGPLGPAPPAMCYYPPSIIHNVIINTRCLATITAFSLGKHVHNYDKMLSGQMLLMESSCSFAWC